MSNHLLTNLEHSRALIADPKNWIQGSYQDRHGGHCMVGAVETTTWVFSQQDEVFRALCAQLPTGYDTFKPGDDSAVLVRFNDSRFRRHKQILKVWDAAIEAEKKAGAERAYAKRLAHKALAPETIVFASEADLASAGD